MHCNIQLVAQNATKKGDDGVVNVNKLRAKMVENGINAESMSKKIGIDRSTFYRKLSADGQTFTIGEADVISKELSKKLQEMIGFRNVAIHNYQTIDLGILQKIVENNLEDILELAREIIKIFLKFFNLSSLKIRSHNNLAYTY